MPSVSITADGSGNWTITFAITAGDYLLATGRDGSNNTSEFSICRLTTLPIELTNFTFDCQNNKVQINWTTATETNNDFFTIECTSDGINDLKTFVVDSKAISGNSTQAITYSFIDDEPLFRINYYRLKQTDYDGKFEYFDLVSVNCNNDSNKSDVLIYPNPSNGYFVIMGLEENTFVNVTNVFGQIIYSTKVNTNETVVDISNQAKGMYFINAYSSKKNSSKKMLVE